MSLKDKPLFQHPMENIYPNPWTDKSCPIKIVLIPIIGLKFNTSIIVTYLLNVRGPLDTYYTAERYPLCFYDNLNNLNFFFLNKSKLNH